MDRGVLVELDSGGRLSLRRLAGEDDRYFLAQRRSDGTILLVPADVAVRRPVVEGEHEESISLELVDLSDPITAEVAPDEGSWWEQRREEQSQNAPGE